VIVKEKLQMEICKPYYTDKLIRKNVPSKDEVPGCHGRFNLRGNNDGYIGNVVKGSISHNDTRGCLSPAVDSSHPTYSQQIKRLSKSHF